MFVMNNINLVYDSFRTWGFMPWELSIITLGTKTMVVAFRAIRGMSVADSDTDTNCISFINQQ